MKNIPGSTIRFLSHQGSDILVFISTKSAYPETGMKCYTTIECCIADVWHEGGQKTIVTPQDLYPKGQRTQTPERTKLHSEHWIKLTAENSRLYVDLGMISMQLPKSDMTAPSKTGPPPSLGKFKMR